VRLDDGDGDGDGVTAAAHSGDNPGHRAGRR
jgi:hypothetical protein